MWQKLILKIQEYMEQRYRRRILKRLVLSLACLVVFGTTYALILPAITMEQEFPSLEGDHAYVSQIEITDIVTGTAPFDTEAEEGEPGIDISAEDRIVRTFDDITYHFNVSMVSYEHANSYGAARVKLEFVLPLGPEEAVFDESAMAWMDTEKGYAPRLTEDTRQINGEAVVCQVLTCYKHLLPTEDHHTVIPGEFGNNVTIKVLSMKNGAEIKPIFSAAMEYSTWDGICQQHNISEKKERAAESVIVTAAPKYNVQIALDPGYKTTVDFSEGNEHAANKGISEESQYKMAGRMNCLSVTLQLYNDDLSKGLKGIELPEGDITFDLDLNARYRVIKDGKAVDIDVTSEYTPLLWSYGGNDSSYVQEDGRSVEKMSVRGAAMRAPYNEGGGENSCFQGGIWKATQEGNKIHITVSGYEIKPDSFPVKNTEIGEYTANIGCFSAGELWLLQPFNEVGSVTNLKYSEKAGYDIQKKHGMEGTIVVEIQDHSMKAVSISETSFADGAGTNDRQMNQGDDRCTESNHLTAPGVLANRIFYSFYGNIWNTEKGWTWEAGTDSIKDRINPDRFYDGKDTVPIGENLSMVSGFYYEANGEEDNRMVCATTLMKFDGDAIMLERSSEARGQYPMEYAHTDSRAKEKVGFDCRVRYATKKDGTNWNDDSELKETDEAELIFYDDIEAIPEGKKCVAALFIYTGSAENDYMSNADLFQGEVVYSSLTAKVRNDPSLIGKVYMLTETTRIWAKKDYDKAERQYSELPYDWSKRTIDPSTGIAGSEGKNPSYTKEEYFSTGGAKGCHVGGPEWGDSLLITGYELGITKNLAQRTAVGKNWYLEVDGQKIPFSKAGADIQDAVNKMCNTYAKDGGAYLTLGSWDGTAIYSDIKVAGIPDGGDWTANDKATGDKSTEGYTVTVSGDEKGYPGAAYRNQRMKITQHAVHMKVDIKEPDIKESDPKTYWAYFSFSSAIPDLNGAESFLTLGGTKNNLPIVLEHNNNGKLTIKIMQGWGQKVLCDIENFDWESEHTFALKIDTEEKYTYNLDLDQRVVDFVLQPCFQPGSDKTTQQTTIYIVDTLPKYLRFQPGSCYFGGSYEQTSENGGTRGKVLGGEQVSPYLVEDNEDGTQTVMWRIENVSVGQELPKIYYSATIGNKGMESEDVPLNTTNLVNTVYIWGGYDVRQPTKENSNYAEAGLAVTRGSASSFGKYVKQRVVDPDGTIDYVIYRENNAAAVAEVAMVDTMPYNGDAAGSSYNGTYTVSSWRIDTGRCDIDKIKVYYTEEERYRNKTKGEITDEEIKEWKPAAIAPDGTVTAMNGTTPVAWAVLGELAGGKSVRIEMQIKLDSGSAEEESLISGRYINTLSNKNTTTTTEAHSVRCTLEGLTWMDKDYDGIQDKDELTDQGLLSGVKVSLWKLRDGGDPAKEDDYEAYHYQGDPLKEAVEIETGQTISVRASDGQAAAAYRDENGNVKKGRYKFTDLPAGTFAVKFEDKDMQIISPLIASPAKQGEDDTLDSDGVPIYSEDKSRLQRTIILGIEMPKAEDMHVVLYESKYHDSGFYRRGTELPQTGGPGTLPYTFSGIAIMGGTLLYYIKRSRKKNGARSRSASGE